MASAFSSFNPEQRLHAEEPADDDGPSVSSERAAQLDGDTVDLDEGTRAQLGRVGVVDAAPVSRAPTRSNDFDAGSLVGDGTVLPSEGWGTDEHSGDDEVGSRWAAAVEDFGAVMNIATEGRWWDPASRGAASVYSDAKDAIATEYDRATREGAYAQREVAVKGLTDLTATARARLLNAGGTAPRYTAEGQALDAGKAAKDVFSGLSDLFKGAGLLLTVAGVALVIYLMRKK